MGRRWVRFTDDGALLTAGAGHRAHALALARTHDGIAWAPRTIRDQRVQVFCTADDADFAWRGRRHGGRCAALALPRFTACPTVHKPTGVAVAHHSLAACSATTAFLDDPELHHERAQRIPCRERSQPLIEPALRRSRASARVSDPPYYRPHARHSPLTLAHALPLARALAQTHALALARAGPHLAAHAAGSTARAAHSTSGMSACTGTQHGPRQTIMAPLRVRVCARGQRCATARCAPPHGQLKMPSTAFRESMFGACDVIQNMYSIGGTFTFS